MIETFTANNPPMYARSTSVDSRAINLFQSGETVGISKRVLDQQANGANLPDDNLFSDLTLLEPSAFYNDDLTFQQSKIIYSKSNLYDFDEVIFYRYKTLLSSAKTVVVPMSGGYDSRLNLAFAKKYQQEYGYKLLAFHKIQNENITKIVKRVCEMLGVELIFRDDPRKWTFDKRIYDKDFVLMHSGTYRHCIINYSAVLDEFRSLYPDCLFLGFGAECHKGKHYAKYDKHEYDWDKIFGYKIPLNVIEIARKIFDDPISVLDYIHYSAFISKGYGKRCWWYQKQYNIQYPLLNDDFLSAVFSLKREWKEGAALVKRWLGMLKPQLLEIPFDSYCERTFKTPNLFQRIYSHFPKANKKCLGKNCLIIPEKDSSPISRYLMNMLDTGKGKPMYIYQLLLYFWYAERGKKLYWELV